MTTELEKSISTKLMIENAQHLGNIILKETSKSQLYTFKENVSGRLYTLNKYSSGCNVKFPMFTTTSEYFKDIGSLNLIVIMDSQNTQENRAKCRIIECDQYQYISGSIETSLDNLVKHEQESQDYSKAYIRYIVLNK